MKEQTHEKPVKHIKKKTNKKHIKKERKKQAR
jgi:hypothetical protein